MFSSRVFAFLAATVASTAVTSVVATPTVAAAYSGNRQMYPAQLCEQAPGTNGSVGLNPYNQLASTGSTGGAVYCPVVANGSSIEAAGAYVYGYSNGVNNNSQAMIMDAALCQVYAGGGGSTGGQCGKTAWRYSPQGAGSFTLQVSDVSSYSNGNFNYFAIFMNAPTSTSETVLYGYEVDLSSS